MLGRSVVAGFTLVELLVALTITSFVLVAACGSYFCTANEWQRQQGEAGAFLATSRACSTLGSNISQAYSATLETRFQTSDAIAINLPATTANSIYVPTWSNNELQYTSGNWEIFYLSDSTGSYSKSGNILWEGAMSWTNFPSSVVPNSGWSLYYNSSHGQISPISSIKFALDTTGDRPKVTITATSSYTFGPATRQFSLTRAVALRNSD